MKKFFVMLGLLLGFVAQQYASAQETIIAPEAGKEYFVVHSSGMLLSHDTDAQRMKIMTAGTNDNQAWVFEATGDDSYYIKNAGSEMYLGSDNGWTGQFASTPAEMPKGETFARWELRISYLSDQIVLYNVGNKAYAGTDSNAEGSTVYTNKGGNDGKHLWHLIEKTGGAYTLSLESTIASAEELIAQIGTNIGSGHGQYPQAAVDAVTAALAAAKAALSATDQNVVNEAEANLKAAAQACANARIIIIDTTKKYAFKQMASGYVLGMSAANKAVLQGLSNEESQIYTLEPVEDVAYTYNLKNKTGNYIGKANNNYDVIPFAEASEVTQFALSLYTIDEDGLTWYFVRNVSRNGYLASDYMDEGSGIYCDKSNAYTTSCWTLVEIDESQVVTDALEVAIANAQAALEGITIGDAATNYPQSAVDELNAAIAAAQAALEAKASQDAVNAAAAAMNAAIAKFKDMVIIFKADPNKQYYFMQEASSLVLTIASNVATINNPDGSDAQKFRLIPVEEGSTSAYNLQLANGTDYLIRKGGWDTGVGTDPTVDVAKWRFEIADLENGYYLLRKYETSGYFATDDNTPGSWVYCNKGNSANGRWKILEVIEGQAVTGALDAAIAQAQALLDNATVGEEPYCYPQEAIDALTAALAAANAADKSSQETVNEACVALQAAIADFKAAQIQPWFRAEAGVSYRFSINKYETKYLTNVDGSAKTTAAYEAGNAGQHWTLTEVDKANHAYVVSNGDLVLDYDGNVIESSMADAPRWRTVYTNTRNNLDYFALVQDADPTKVLTFSSGNTLVIQTLTVTNNAHQGRFMRVDPVNDSNLGALEIAIANAQVTLNGVKRGPEIGQYSDAKCAAFQALIDEAKTYYSGKTQAEVDAEVAALNQARTDFINNPNSVIRDELDAALAQLATIAANAEIGIEVGQFMWSQIDALKAKHAEFTAQAKTISEQDACDALTAAVLAYIESDGKGHTTKQQVNVVLNDAIACAEAIYEAEKDNIGTDKGQRPQEVINAFRDAIAHAKAVTNPTVADLEALLDAYNAFMNGAISVDRTALRKAIADAQDEKYSALVAGAFDGQYPQDKIDDFQTALATAIDVEADMTKTQDEVNTAASNLNKARTALDAAKVKIAFTALDATIAKADAAVAGVTEIGDGDGKCPQAAVDNINAVINEAKGIDRAAISQADVDALNAKLSEAIDTFRTIVKMNTAIDAAIDAANEMLADVAVGFKPGNYPASAVANMKNAIANAQAVANNAEATQAELLAAVRDLNAAVEAFKAEAVPANDLTALNAAIAKAEAAIAGGLDDMNVILALAFAKEAAEDPNEYTQSEIDTLTSDLENALTLAGIDAAAIANGISINGGILTVAGFEGEYTVAVYAADGRLAAAAKACGEPMQLNLNAGVYVIAVTSAQGTASTTVLVK